MEYEFNIHTLKICRKFCNHLVLFSTFTALYEGENVVKSYEFNYFQSAHVLETK